LVFRREVTLALLLSLELIPNEQSWWRKLDQSENAIIL